MNPNDHDRRPPLDSDPSLDDESPTWDPGRRIAEQQTLVELINAVHGPDHPATLEARRELAQWYIRAHRFDESVTLHRELLADYTRVLGPDHVETLTTGAFLASAYWNTHQGEECLATSTDVADGYARAFGPDHTLTLEARGAVAAGLDDLGRNEEALAIERDIAAVYDRTRGPEHEDTLWAHYRVAYQLTRLNRLDDAVTHLCLALLRVPEGPSRDTSDYQGVLEMLTSMCDEPHEWLDDWTDPPPAIAPEPGEEPG